MRLGTMSSKYVAIIVQCLFLAASAYAGHWLTDNAWQSKHDQHLLADAQANEKAATDALTKQQKLLQELEDAYKTQKHLQEKHDRNVSDSRIAADRLRVELDRIKALPKVTHSSSVAERANAATDRLLLADLLGESDQRAGIYAGEADKLRNALKACNDEYGLIKSHIMQ